MKKSKNGEKTTYMVTVIIAIVLLALLLIFVNVQHKESNVDKNETPKLTTTAKKIIKDSITIDDKKVEIEVEEYKTPWGVTVKYEPLYFRVGADDKFMKFTSVTDKNTYLIIEKLTEDEYNKDNNLKGTEEDGEYVSIHRGIKNGQAYFKVTKYHKNGIEYDNIDIRMEYIIKQIS